MKSELSSVDVKHLAGELDEILSGDRIQKIYELSGKRLLFRTHGDGGKKELILSPNWMFLTQYRRETPEHPTSYAMQLRKLLSGGIIDGVHQAGFERIIQLKVNAGGQAYTLIIELFSKGNVILTDPKGKIRGLLKWQKWRDRVLGVNQEYEYPPKRTSPYEVDEEMFRQVMNDSGRKTASTLASKLGLPGDYAEEACLRAGVDKESKANKLNTQDLNRLHESFREVVEGFSQPTKPVLYYNGDEKMTVLPYPLQVYGDCRMESPDSFNQALDEYFSEKTFNEKKEVLEDKLDEEKTRLEKRLEKQQQGLARMKESEVDDKKRGDLIYQHMNEVNELLEAVSAARAKGLSDEEIKETLERHKDVQAAKYFSDIDKNKLTLDLK